MCLGKLVLITGGARSGKSSYAERLAAGEGENVLYIATAVPFDDEMKLRVEMHRARRPREWQTIEAYKGFDKIIEKNCRGKSAVLLDCITIMITNIIMDNGPDWQSISAERILSIEECIEAEIDSLVSIARREEPLFAVVTNEVGMGLVPEYPLARAFRDIAGRINQKLARAADEVYLCVCGIPVRIK